MGGMITDADAVTYAHAVRESLDRHAGGDEIPDDALSMAADLAEWVDAHAG